MLNEQVTNDFTRGSVPKVIIHMAVPMMLAQVVNVLYSIVDRMYIGHIEGVGSLALTGLGLCMPVITVVTAFTALCGGGGPLCSIARGKGDLDYAEKVEGNALSMLLILALILTIMLQLVLSPVLMAMGASQATLPFAMQYARIYIYGTLFIMLSHGLNYYINAQGFSRVGMITVGIGAVLNVILDPVFIFPSGMKLYGRVFIPFGFGMGISGAALATILSQAVSAAWAIWFITGKRTILKLRICNMRLDREIVKRIAAVGTTGFVMAVTNSMVQISYNHQLKVWGGDIYIGIMTIINSVREVFFLVNSGMREGAQPVIGYNYGASAFKRVKEGIRFLAVFSFCYAGVAWICIMVFTEQIVRIFNNDVELISLAVPSMHIFFSGFVFMSLMIAGQGVFLALGRAKYAVTFSILRKVIIVTPFIYMFPRIGHWGVRGIFWAEPVSDLLGGAACFLTMYFTVYRKISLDMTNHV